MPAMNISAIPKILPDEEDVPVISATPVSPARIEAARLAAQPQRSVPSSREAGGTRFLREFRLLVGASRLYQHNHPRLLTTLASAEHELRCVLRSEATLVFAVERRGISMRPEAGSNDSSGGYELLTDRRGELRALAEELLRGGICSFLFTTRVNMGELSALAQQLSQVPRNASPDDTASRESWDRWLRERGVMGIRLNVPTERHDSLQLASMVSAVLGYDDAPHRAAQTAMAQPVVTCDEIASTLRIVSKLAPPDDSETKTSSEDVARRIHSVLSGADRYVKSLLVYGVSVLKPREGERLDLYLERLTDALILGFAKQEFSADRIGAQDLAPLLGRLDRERILADKNHPVSSGGAAQVDEAGAAALCEKFWNSLPARQIGRTLRGPDSWCMPPAAVARYLDPLTSASTRKSSEAAGREARLVLLAYARCLGSEEGKARRAVASGLTELAPQLERLWPHPAMPGFSRGIVQALLLEVSPGIAGLLSALVEHLARLALSKQEYAEFERILELLESFPRDAEHAHISMLLARILNDEHWLYLVDEALANKPLNPLLPRLLRRGPDRLIDRLGLLLTAPQGVNALPAMVRLVQSSGEPVLGALEARLYEPRRQRLSSAIHLLASADPKRLANALPRALPSWEWSLQDLAVSELGRCTNPEVAAVAARAFLSTVGEAHALVVPCMIDQLGSAQEKSAVPLLLQVAAGEHLTLRDIYFRIKAAEALGRMQVAEAAPVLRQIVRERNGLVHSEPGALRVVAEEALVTIENSGAPPRKTTRQHRQARPDPIEAHSRPRRYLRVQLPKPLPAAIGGGFARTARIRTLSLGGALLESERHLSVGESLRLEIRSGLSRIQSTAVVRSVLPRGTGVEFIHMKAEDRERLRRLVTHELE